MKKNALLRFNGKDVDLFSSEKKYQGFFSMDEYKLTHKLFSGAQSPCITREIFERGDGVVVMPYDPTTDQILLIEQFRPGAIRACNSTSSRAGGSTINSPWLLEFIAGMFDENESPTEVAIREAKEEANIDLSEDSLTPIMQYLSSPGGMSECMHLYLAKIDSGKVSVGEVHGLDEENEDILLHLMSRTEALSLLAQGKISNATTIIGLQWLALNYQTLS
ncbi:MAG: NUDIX domain-containing protein [Colwellia sp.]